MRINRLVFQPWLHIVLLLLCLCWLWQAAVTLFHVPQWLLPAPWDIAVQLVKSWPLLLPHLAQTVFEVIAGLAFAIITGLMLAAVLDYSPVLRRLLYPLLVMSQSFPVIILAPLLVIWFGFGLAPKILVVALFCFFPIAVNTTDGFAATSDELMDLLTSMRARWWQRWSKVRFPAAIPSFFSGLKVAVSYSVIAAVVGEWVGGELGLGIYLLRVSASFQTVQVFVVVLLIFAISLILFACVLLIQRLCIPWHQPKKSTSTHLLFTQGDSS